MTSPSSYDKKRRDHWSTVLTKTEPAEPNKGLCIAGASKSIEKAVVCKFCFTTLRNRREYNEHISTVHKDKMPHTCDTCGLSFGQSGTMRRCKRSVHLGLRPCPCDLCDLSFGQNEDLKKHKAAVHFKLKPYECVECGRNFSRKDHLASHVTNVHRGLKT